jgi:cytochrome c oxidase assembly protein subunit 15
VTLSWWVVGGTVAQILLGGATVLLDLNPIVVSVHFLVSMGLLWVAALIWWRSRSQVGDAAPPPPPLPSRGRLLARAAVPLASAVLLTGTVVTGSGPHSGDPEARRLGFELVEVTRVHTTTVWLLVACLVSLAVLLNRSPLPSSPRLATARRLSYLTLLAALVQGAIGYTQWALGVPAALVEAHVVGAVTVWTVVTLLHFALFDQPSMATTDDTARPADDDPRRDLLSPTGGLAD